MNSKFTVILFFVFNLLIVLTIIMRVPKVHFESSVFSLLPKTEKQRQDEQFFSLEEKFFQNLDKEVIFLVKDDNPSHNEAHARLNLENFINGLKNSGYVKNITAKIDAHTTKELSQFIFLYKHALLNYKARLELTKDNYVKKILSRIYAGFAGIGSTELNHDPLLLSRLILDSIAKEHFALHNGFLSIKDKDGSRYKVIHLVLNQEHDNIEFSENFVSTVEALMEQYEKHCQSEDENKVTPAPFFKTFFEKPKTYPHILYLGAVFYANYAAKTSKEEITVLGTVTLGGVLLLIYTVFASLKPALYALFSIVEGVLLGFTALILIYDNISIITLGLSLSVVGIVCDYTIYYCILYKYRKPFETARSIIDKLQKPLLFAALTDIIAYLIILYSELTILQQFAVFASFTISGALFFVILIEPMLLDNSNFKHTIKLRFYTHLNSLISLNLNFIVSRSKQLLNKSLAYTVIFLSGVLSLYGLLNYKINDDPYSFMTMPENLKSQEVKITSMLNHDNSLNYLYLETDSQDNLISSLGIAKSYLDALIKDHCLVDYDALLINDQETIKKDHVLILKKLSALKESLLQANLRLKDPDPYSLKDLSLDEYLLAPSFMSKSHLYLANSEKGRYGTIIMLYDITNQDKIIDTFKDFHEIKFVDRHKILCTVFATLRNQCSHIFLCFLLALAVVLTLRLGPKLALLYALMLSLACCSSIGLLTLLGYSINIFMILGLILIVGIGINYMVFYTFNHTKSCAILALITALLTTLMTIGILAFSSVSAISVFALSLITGLLLSFMMTIYIPVLVPTLIPVPKG